MPFERPSVILNDRWYYQRPELTGPESLRASVGFGAVAKFRVTVGCTRPTPVSPGRAAPPRTTVPGTRPDVDVRPPASHFRATGVRAGRRTGARRPGGRVRQFDAILR